MDKNLKAIFNSFKIREKFDSAVRLNAGHINDTYRIRVQNTRHPGYILQRINDTVFRNVPGLMNNISLVSEHIINKIQQGLGESLSPDYYQFFKSNQDVNYYKDEQGGFWRLTTFVPSHSYDWIDVPEKAGSAGSAYGHFLNLLSDLDTNKLCETIPKFHNIEYRLKQFDDTCVNNAGKRIKNVSPELAFVESRREEMRNFLSIATNKKFPKRITHNDTKINNILFDEKNNVIGVIDLDTVMPGYIHYDFGDAIRTGATTAPEDEPDISKIELDMRLYVAFAVKFLEKTLPVLLPEEVVYLAFSAKLLTFIMGLRFLTDYINGDIYYKIEYPEHNLVRSRAQFKLLSSMENQYGQMRSIVEEVRKNFLHSKMNINRRGSI